MQNSYNHDKVFLVGDHHGSFRNLNNSLRYFEITNSLIIHVGDGGEGFYGGTPEQYFQNSEIFEESGNTYLSIRGNHSDPSFFSKEIDEKYGTPYFRLIPDYTVLTIKNLKWFFVGGAISIDRNMRILREQKDQEKIYWSDENFCFKKELAEKCDVLVTHSAPLWIGPRGTDEIISYFRNDKNLKKDCENERMLHNELFEICQPKYYFMGHFHKHYESKDWNCYSRILDILEIVEFKEKPDLNEETDSLS